jgi:hypothetical protein
VQTEDGITRLVACWVDFFKPGKSLVLVAFSDGGGSWSPPTIISHGQLCTVGSDDSRVAVNEPRAAVTWFDAKQRALKFRISNDGQVWDSVRRTLAETDPLVDGVSTTDKVLVGPYAFVLPGPSGLRAVWEVRRPSLNGEISKVFVGDLGENSQGEALGNENIEKFLPGAGRCGKITGAYQVLSGLFRYTVWEIDTTPPKRLFTSGADLDGQNGFPGVDDLKKIGDYTGADCVGSVGWAVEMCRLLRQRNPRAPYLWFTRSAIAQIGPRCTIPRFQ